MLLSNYYYYFKSVIPIKICNEIIQYALNHKDNIAITGQFGENRNLNCSFTVSGIDNKCVDKGLCSLKPNYSHSLSSYKESCTNAQGKTECEGIWGAYKSRIVNNICVWNEGENKWFGDAPFCDGECDEEGPFPNLIVYDNWGDGLPCLTGGKALCSKKKSKNIWCGTAPFCNGVCPDRCRTLVTDDHGDGYKCYTGNKVLCDCTDNPNATCPE